MFTIFKHSQSVSLSMTFGIKDKTGQEDEETWEKKFMDSARTWSLKGAVVSGPLGLCYLVSHGSQLGGDILQCNSASFGDPFVAYNISCSREMHPRSPFPCLMSRSNTHHIMAWATGRFRIWPCKILTHRQEPGLPWSSCYCNLRAKEETHQAPQQSLHPVKQHFSTSLTLPVQITGSTCSAVRTRTYKERKPNKTYPFWHESSISGEKNKCIN